MTTWMDGMLNIYSYPLMGEVYKRRRYLTSYGKTQKTNFAGVVVDRNAEPDSYSGIVSISDGMITLGDNGEAVYELMCRLQEATIWPLSSVPSVG